jgi:hypothetical protein
MTVIQPNSISGITSITAQGDTINLYKSDGTAAGLNLNGINLSNTSGVSTFSSLIVTNLNASGVATFAQSNPTNLNVSGVGTVASLRATNINATGVSTFSGTINVGTGGNVITTTGIGSVGIGTTNPRSPLEVRVSRTSSTSATVLTLSDDVTGAQTNGVFKAIRSASNGNASVSEIRFIETDGTNNNTAIALVTAPTAGTLIEGFRLHSNSNVGIGSTVPTAKLNVVGNAVGNIVGLGTTNATTTLDLSAGNNFSLTLVGNINIANPSNIVAGQSGFISIVQDGTGSRTVGWGSYWDFPASTAPTLTTTANGVDVVAYYVRTTTSIAADAIIGIGTL